MMSFRILISFLFLAAGMYIIGVVNLTSHENVHYGILSHDGCKNITMEVDHVKLSGYVRCEDPGYVESDKARLSHNYNEIIGYNLNSLLATILLSVIFLALLRGDRS